ncbi:beta-ketoacyl-[acyl-carrier-protein] synthase family protein, partial [Dactylosporangium fulvum]|uniref:beta-ketoacyl-[acyl-carrier-protein] synthase family protein n=1 Tax=Dactylosporangium fulvum TaxID=53359 RepID=UPI0031D7D101
LASGYLVDADQFALFDAGRALSTDGQVRPFSSGRRGLLLGDGAGAVVVESATAARDRGAPVLARLAGWGRAGDAYHPCQPHPEGRGMARAVTAALQRGGIAPEAVGYVNAHGSGTAQSDAAETKALHTALGEHGAAVPVSSTKALHGQALEASGVLELVVTLHALNSGRLPVNAGFLAADDECRLNLVLDHPSPAAPAYALTLNAAFGGANTALLLGAP